MSDPGFWKSGSLPSESELRDYLRGQGLSGDESQTIIDQYRTGVLSTSDAYTWSHDQVNEWVNRKVGESVLGHQSQGRFTDNIVTKQAGVTPSGSPTGSTDSGAESGLYDQIIAQRMRDEAELNSKGQSLADQRSQVIQSQVQSYYDRAPTIKDSGPAPGTGMAESIALGFKVDENGNPVLDENGNPVQINPAQLWSEIAGMSFNMGSVSPATSFGTPEKIGRQTAAGYRTINYFRPAQVMAMLAGMDPDYISRLQHKMWEAGLYESTDGKGAIPSWGQADVATRKAFSELFITASTNPQEPIDAMLDRMATERITRQQAPDSGPGASPEQLPSFTPEVTSADTLSQSIDEIAQHLRGHFASDKEKATLIKTLQAKETAAQRTQYDRSIADLQAKAGYGSAQGAAGGGGIVTGDQEIDRFMSAIGGKESGGKYGAVNPDSGAAGKFQIMPGNWAPWAERAGLGAHAPRTPQNQEIVARRIMLDYYKQFGNWRDVAVAWYSGPGRVAQLRDSTTPQGKYPSIAAYADDVMSRFASTGHVLPPGATAAGTVYPATERFDPAATAEALLKAQDPVGWHAHGFADQAINFFSLLKGVV